MQKLANILKKNCKIFLKELSTFTEKSQESWQLFQENFTIL